MSTRSEIRFFKNGKLNSCVYHHMDGYPSHIISDLAVVGEGGKKIMGDVSKLHGTQEVKCAHGDKSMKYQGDIDYSYEVNLKQERKTKGGFQPSPDIQNVKIFKHTPFSSGKEKVFDGDIWEAHKKFVCEGEE